jgi:hypothetical protein
MKLCDLVAPPKETGQHWTRPQFLLFSTQHHKRNFTFVPAGDPEGIVHHPIKLKKF